MGVPEGYARFQDTPVAAVRDYWDRRPCNLRHSSLPVGSREYFDEVERRKYFVEPDIPAFAAFGRWAGARVLEIGCGIGTDTINFARSGATVTAVDLSAESIGIARQRAEVFGLADRVTFVCSDAETMDGVAHGPEFDLVYSFGAIHHTPHPSRVLAQARKRLRPAGTLKVMVYHRRSWKTAGIVIGHGHGRFWRADRLIAEHSEAERGCPVTYSYTRRQAAELVGAAGFRVEEVSVDHIFPYRVKEYVAQRYVKQCPFDVLPAGAVRMLERHFGWHLMVTAVAT